MCCWSLWYRRNQSLLGVTNSYPIDDVIVARQCLDNYRHASVCLNNSISDCSNSGCWVPPDVGHVKINYDAACLNSPKETTVGLIARDSHGSCLAWRVKINRSPLDPESAEAWAAKSAFSPNGNLIEDIKQIRESSSSKMVFSHVRRNANCVAHYLARNARVLDNVSSLPSVVVDLGPGSFFLHLGGLWLVTFTVLLEILSSPTFFNWID